jgi:hypothetical protein
MAIPGFSAEMSLSKSRQTHSVAVITSSRQLQITPQMRMQCLVTALMGYRNCLLNLSDGVPWQTCQYDFHNAVFDCTWESTK